MMEIALAAGKKDLISIYGDALDSGFVNILILLNK